MVRKAIVVFSLCLAAVWPGAAQISGGITGSVMDTSGAVISGAAVAVRNVGTNLELKVVTQANGTYLVPNLPAGDYNVSFSKEGFKTETHTSILVQGDRTSTVNGRLEVGAVATTVEVTATPLLNQVDTTSGYVLDAQSINNAPLGTGSFTQLAILNPGLSADFLNGSGTNAGLGNQAIWANGQRDSSNSFTINGVSTDNLFNGKSTSQVASNRFTLNTGQSSLPANDTLTSVSVYDAVGQGMATPPAETLQELRVNASMYDASQGAKSGAHIDATTISGTNSFHGQVYDYFQNSAFNAASFFRNASTAISAHDKVPSLKYNRFGPSIGGPIKKDRLFFYVAYQGVRDRDAQKGTSTVVVPLHLTDDRSAQGLAAMALADFGKTIAPSSIDPAAIKLFQAKVGNSYLIPTPTITDATLATRLGYDAFLQAPAQFQEDLGIFDADYVFNSRDHIALKSLFQSDPNSTPFGGGATLGFPKELRAGADTASIDNATILTPSLTWDQKIGFARSATYAQTLQDVSATDVGINAFGSTQFPALSISKADNTIARSLSIGPSGNFANAGTYQNLYSGSTNLNWVHGRHTVTFGANWDHVQLNIINQQNNTPNVAFADIPSLPAGNVTGSSTSYFIGNSERYYRAEQIGAFANDNIRLTPELTVNLGLRYDFDGPLSEKYGRLTNFHPDQFQYNPATDTIVHTGLVVAGNNPTLATPGVSDSTLTGRQWGFAPRVGIVWSPSSLRNLVFRAGFGIYYDRGEYFSEFSPSSGSGFNGPFGVTLSPPFIQQVSGTSAGTLSNPFTGAVVPPAVTNNTLFAGLVPNKAQLLTGARTYLFGGYDPSNVLPYTENISFDVQWQPLNDWHLTLGFVGNRGLHPGAADSVQPGWDCHARQPDQRRDLLVRIQPGSGRDRENIRRRQHRPAHSLPRYLGQFGVLQGGRGFNLQRPAVRAAETAQQALPDQRRLHLVPHAGRAERPGAVLQREQSAGSTVVLRHIRI